jgi:2-polyprenyl-6-hydroxyphenyl methylase/3-demethylubiquinone-9 3-methyltransferase
MPESPPEPSWALAAYTGFADRYAAMAPTKPHNGLYERPATLALLGDIAGLRVLDAGCGPGIASAMLAKGGARVTGLDVTPRMIELARERCRGLEAEFLLADLAQPLTAFADASFDRVLCSLAFDYIAELAPVLAEFRRVTRPGGAIVFSMSHPMSDWTNERIRGEGIYYERTRFGLHWTGFGEPAPYVEAYRRPLAEILNAVVEAGCRFEHMVEPQPVPEMKAVSERIYERLARAPEFLCIRASR